MSCRVVALWAAMGASLRLWLIMTFFASWLPSYLISNDLDPTRRSALLRATIVSAGLGATIGAVLLLLARRRGRPLSSVEHASWLASPIALIAFFPVLFRYKAWVNRDVPLLALTAVFTLLVEGTLVRVFRELEAHHHAKFAPLRIELSERLRRHGALLSVLVASAGFAVYASYYSIVRHHKFETSAYDLGIYDNVMYNCLHGRFMRVPIMFGSAPTAPSFLTNHAQFSQYIFIPIYALFPSAETLLIIQSVLIAGIALPLYLFAKARVSPWAAALVALAYLAYHPLHGATFNQMTFLPVATFFVVATVWAADAKRWIWFGVLFSIAILMREDIPIGFAVIGLVLLMSGHRPRAGLFMLAFSVVYFLFVRLVVMDRAGSWIFPRVLYGGLVPPGVEPSFKEVMKTVVANPTYVFATLLTEPKLTYLLHLLVPVAFLPLRRAWLLVALVPGVMLTLLTTNYGAATAMGRHYVMHWTPYLFLAVPLALEGMKKDAGGWLGKPHAALAAMLLATSITSYQLGAFAHHPSFRVGPGTTDFAYTQEHRDRYAEAVRVAALISKDASVAATDSLTPHVSNRLDVYMADDRIENADYLFYRREDLGNNRAKQHLGEALRTGRYGLVKRDGDIALFERGHDVSGNGALMTDWEI